MRGRAAISDVVPITLGFLVLLLAAQPSIIPEYVSAMPSKFDFSGVANIVISVNGDDTRFSINPDYTSFFDDVTGQQLIPNNQAKDVKRLEAEAGDTLTVSFDCVECTFIADLKIYLVDGKSRDSDIADGGETPFEIVLVHIDCDFIDCNGPNEILLPDELKSGKYKIVFDRDEDEGHYFYINKIKIS